MHCSTTVPHIVVWENNVLQYSTEQKAMEQDGTASGQEDNYHY